jgi:hypothetical protein
MNAANAGSLILGLVMMCVIMLATAERMEQFLYGDGPRPERPSHPAWQIMQDNYQTAVDLGYDFVRLFGFDLRSQTVYGHDTDTVVLDENSVYRVWVWTTRNGEFQASSINPQNGHARELLVPNGMSVQEYLNPASAASKKPHQDNELPAMPEELSPEAVSRARAMLDEMTPEQRKAMMRRGMEALKGNRGAPPSP